jgi:hypothetical protein
VRRIGVLAGGGAADDPDGQAQIAAFLQGLQQLGWTDGRNVRIDMRWATTNADDLRRHAAELAELAPDVLVAATGTATVAPLMQATRTVPIVFPVAGIRYDLNTTVFTRSKSGPVSKGVAIVIAPTTADTVVKERPSSAFAV